jgi:hypothetical protein
MTRHHRQFTRAGSGYNFGGAAAQRIRRNLRATAAVNATRLPCSICALLILPGAMAAHMDIVHGDDE